MTSTATISEVTAQRKTGRLTTGTASYTITLNATPTAGDLIVIATTTNGVVVTQNAPTYGGTTATVASTGALNGSLQIKTWYIVTNSTNIAAGGTTVGVTNSAASTTAGYAVTAIRNADTTTPIGVTGNGTGSVTNNGYAYPFQASGGNNTVSTAQGSTCLFFVTLNGAYNGAALYINTPTTSIGLGGQWGPATGAAADVQSASVQFSSDPATEITLPSASTGGPLMLEVVAASRNYSATWISINPGTYAPQGVPISETETVAETQLITTDAPQGAEITSSAADLSNYEIALDVLTGSPIDIGASPSAITSTALPVVKGTAVATSAAVIPNSVGTVEAKATTLAAALVIPPARYTEINKPIDKPGSVRGKAKWSTSTGAASTATVVGRARWSTLVGDMEVIG